jgi:hypothetical protein
LKNSQSVFARTGVELLPCVIDGIADGGNAADGYVAAGAESKQGGCLHFDGKDALARPLLNLLLCLSIGSVGCPNLATANSPIVKSPSNSRTHKWGDIAFRNLPGLANVGHQVAGRERGRFLEKVCQYRRA